MKKEEAMQIAKEKSKVVMDTIAAILTDTIIVEGKMEFSSAKKDAETLCTLDISVPKKEYYRNWYMGVTIDHAFLFYYQILEDILDNFDGLEKIKVSNFYSVYDKGKNFKGITFKNSIGSKLNLNFISQGKDFEKLVSFFNESRKEIEEHGKTK